MLELITSNPVLAAILALTLIALLFGAILGFASVKFKTEGDPLIDQVDAILPQTQCGQCGYPGCKPYANAIVNEDVPINRCPPGGQNTIDELATLLGVDSIPLDAEHGIEEEIKTVAYIHEDICIGCTKCIQACPVDAILGAAKLMHTVIASECTGCDLCVEPCPVDCIDMVPVESNLSEWAWNIPISPSQQNKIIATDKAV